MKKFIPILKKTQIFAGVAENEIAAMLGCLEARLCSYKKGEYIYSVRESISTILPFYFKASFIYNKTIIGETEVLLI